MLDLFYRFGSNPNWDGYCNLEVDKVVERQSTESDIEKRKRLSVAAAVTSKAAAVAPAAIAAKKVRLSIVSSSMRSF